MAHTPGPWILRDGKIVSEKTKDDIYHLCDDATYNANMRLVSAAPDLLEACKAVRDCNIDYALPLVITAISKAEANTNWPGKKGKS